jgi:hypothetical protein
MTDVLTLRRCSVCGVLESDLSSVFVFDQASQDVIHLVGNACWQSYLTKGMRSESGSLDEIRPLEVLRQDRSWQSCSQGGERRTSPGDS